MTTNQQPAHMLEEKKINNNLLFSFQYCKMIPLSETEELENKNFIFQSIAEESQTKKMIWLFEKLCKEFYNGE
jgi:hypothetical protein